MPAQPTNDAERWHALATEARTAAAQFTDPQIRRAMLLIAAAYDRLAEHAAARKNEEM
jgi:hypothetical protein